MKKRLLVAVLASAMVMAEAVAEDRVFVWAGVAGECQGMGKTTGGNKSVKPGTKVSLKATANKGNAFAGWYEGDDFVSEKASFSYAAEDRDAFLSAQFVSAAEDYLSVSVNCCKYYLVGEDIRWSSEPADDGSTYFRVDSRSMVTVTMSGLPSGVKSKVAPCEDGAIVTFYGSVGKQGVYWVTCTAKNGNGYKSTATLRLQVGWPPETDYDDIGLGDSLDFLDYLTTGCPVDTCLNAGLKSVSGLPTGLKFDAGSGSTCCFDFITGMPTKAGKFKVTFTDRAKRKTVKTVVVKDAGSRYLDVRCGRGCEGRGKVTGTGVYAVGTKVKLTATPGKGYYFAGWFWDKDFESPIYMASGDYRKKSDTLETSEEFWPDTVYAKFVSKDEDSYLDLQMSGANVSWGVWYVDSSGPWDSCWLDVTSETMPTISVSGLPSGCSYDKQWQELVFAKQPTKPGIYDVKITVKNVSGAKIVRWLTVVVPNLRAEDVFEGLDYDGEYRVTRGVSDACFEMCSFSIAGGWKVTASGLPPGLKFGAEQNSCATCVGEVWGSISGTPTKAGTYTVKLTAKRNGLTRYATVTFVVDPLPAYVVGKFNGVLMEGAGEYERVVGTFTMTATETGKQSVSLTLMDGTKKTYSADAWNCVDGAAYVGAYHKSPARGSCAEDGEWVTLTVVPDSEVGWTGYQLTGEFMCDPCRVGGEGKIKAQRNPFGKVNGPYENVVAHWVASTLAGYGKMKCYADQEDSYGFEYVLSCPNCCIWGGMGKPADLTFTVTADGTVKVAGRIGAKSVSGSSVLRCLGGGSYDSVEPQADFRLYVNRTPILIHVDFAPGYGADGAANGWASVGW